MNILGKTWNTFRDKRIDRIANWPPSRILSNRWVKRSLAATAVISSWGFLLLLIPGFLISVSPKTPWQLFTALLMIGSFMLLRQSVRRITSLPDEYLDEREIENRDWAYRLGYLVVRRIGLVLTLCFVGFSIYAKLSYSATEFISGIQEPRSVAQELWLRGSSFIQGFLAPDPLFESFMVLGVLTFVAYSFPVILLAWRESNMEPLAQPVEHWRDSLQRYSKGYFRRLIRGVWVFAFAYVAVIGHQQDFWINLVISLLVYAIYVYFWGLFIQFEISGKLKSYDELELQNRRILLACLNYGSLAIGAVILVANWITQPGSANFCTPIAVILVSTLEVISFILTYRMSNFGEKS